MTTETRPSITIEDLPQLPPVARRLWEAREWLRDENHWCKFARQDPQGRTCALGATQYLYGRDEWEDCDAASLILGRVVRGRDGLEGMFDVIRFNNALSTTHADILALFDWAIELALKEGK